MFQNSWSIKLDEPPIHLITACLPNPSFVYQGSSNKLLVYTDNQTQSLPIRKQVISLGVYEEDKILILTRYSLSCFDALNNEQKFNIQFQNAQKLQVLAHNIYVISGCSLFCYNFMGEQVYVNNIAEPILSLANISDDNKQISQVVISTKQMTMLKYHKHNVVFDYGKIIGKATALCWIGKGVMVGTQQGSIAYYQSKKYKWKAKSIHSVFKIFKYSQVSSYAKNVQFLQPKQDQIVVIRNNGSMQLRDWQNGGTLAKFKVGQNIINSFITDFRKQGTNQIICGLQSGNVRAFNLKTQAQQKKQSNKNSTAQETIQKGNQIEDLNKIKLQIMYNISRLKQALGPGNQNQNDNQNQQLQIVKNDFKMTASLIYEQGLVLSIKTVNGYISGLTFQQAIMPIFVEKTNHLKYKFIDSTQIAGEITCQVFVHSSLTATKYEVRKISINLPKFWKWGLDSKPKKQISGKVKFKIIERSSRIILWSKQSFYMNLNPVQEERLGGLSQMRLRFYNWYHNQQIQLAFFQNQGKMMILCDSLKAMGEIFQDLINYLGLKNVNSQLQFPQQKQKIKSLLQSVQKLTQNKMSVSMDLTQTVGNIKFLLVKGENSRVVGSMNSFRKTFAQMMELNRNLINEIDKKNYNLKILTQALKNVNNFINLIANVRHGDAKNQVIAKCRDAIKNKKFPEIFNIMDFGAEGSLK